MQRTVGFGIATGLIIGLGLATLAQEGRPSFSCAPNNDGLTLPAGFCAILAAHTGGIGRHMAVAPNPEYFDAKQNAELPSEELLRIEEGSNFGWPYCYHDWQQGNRVSSPEYGGDGRMVRDCGRYPSPAAAYPGHWAPGSIVFYDGQQFPARYRGGAFIAFQGSWNRAPEPAGGYKVVFQPFEGTKASGPYEVFVDGFAGVSPLMRREDAKARPSGLAVAPDGSLYVSDMVGGKIWRIVYQGP